MPAGGAKLEPVVAGAPGFEKRPPLDPAESPPNRLFGWADELVVVPAVPPKMLFPAGAGGAPPPKRPAGFDGAPDAWPNSPPEGAGDDVGLAAGAPNKPPAGCVLAGLLPNRLCEPDADGFPNIIYITLQT